MRRSTIVFFVFALLIGGLIAYNQYLKNQPPVEVVIAVDPTMREWANALAAAFNAQNVLIGASGQRASVRIDASFTDMQVWQDRTGWRSEGTHPSGWLPSSSLVTVGLSSQLPFVLVESSLARSPLLWGGFESRVALMTADGSPFDWQAAQRAASAQRWQALGGASDWGNVNIAINWVNAATSGVCAVLTAAATYQQSVTVDRAALMREDFGAWFAPLRDALLNARRLAGSPALAMATRGATVADFALLPEFQWLVALETLLRQERMTFAYPAYNVELDFPLLLWQDAQTTDAQRATLRAFADFALSESGQAVLKEFGLRPASGSVSGSDALFARAVQYGVRYQLDGQRITTPDRLLSEQLIRLLEN